MNGWEEHLLEEDPSSLEPNVRSRIVFRAIGDLYKFGKKTDRRLTGVELRLSQAIWLQRVVGALIVGWILGRALGVL